MVTKFGKFCRNIRMDHGDLLYDMARKLGVSSAFLSRVENGKAKPPMEWKKIIVSEYQLNTEQELELEKYMSEARENVIRIDSLSQEDKDMMFAFARQLDGLGKDERDKWRKLLKM